MASFVTTQLTFQSDSPEETRRIGRAIGAMLRAGDAVLLSGELGAGKTTLARAMAEGLGIAPESVSSPTFILMAEHSGQTDLVHVDAYRISSAEDLESAGWDRVSRRLDEVVVVVEWPERVKGLLAGRRSVTARIGHAGPESRVIDLRMPEGWPEREGFGDLRNLASTRCPVTGELVRPDAPSWPFSSERARLADLHGWLHERHGIPRAVDPGERDQGEDEEA